jgi:hypothetical protein
MRHRMNVGVSVPLPILSLCLAAAGASSCGGGSSQPVNLVDGGVPDAQGADALSLDGVPRGSMRLAVPAYFPPGPDWQRVIAGAPTVGIVIFNPNSGPGTATDPGYTSVIAQARAAGIVVLGYVSTAYGQRAAADVTADINKYYDLYAPSGIYLAEGPMQNDCATLEDEYHGFTNTALARDPHAYLAVGTNFCPTFIYFTDLMIEFARTWDEYQTYVSPSWMPANSPSRFCHIIDSVPPDSLGLALTMASHNGAGFVFATDGVEPNPWGALPSYFDEELATLRP